MSHAIDRVSYWSGIRTHVLLRKASLLTIAPWSHSRIFGLRSDCIKLRIKVKFYCKRNILYILNPTTNHSHLGPYISSLAVAAMIIAAVAEVNPGSP